MSTTFTSALGTFNVVDDACWFEIDGVPSSCGASTDAMAWDCMTPMALLRPQPLRNGGGLTVPGAHGRLPRKRRRDAFDVVLKFHVYGKSNPFGGTSGAEDATFVDNLLFLRDNLGDMPTTTYSTRTCTLYAPNDGIYTGDVQVEVDWADEAGPPMADIAVTVTLLTGLTELSSS